tara:strand:+ start:9266 stop:9736 length:471 start_codon:yes stop_codon:yes gene_type:complete
MKNNKLSRFLNIFVALVAVIGAFLFIRVLMEDVGVIENNPEVQNSLISPIIFFSTGLLYLAIGATLVVSLIGLMKNPDNLKKTVLGLAVLGVILVLAYFSGDSLAVTDPQGKVLPGGEAGSSVNQWVSTGIWYSMFLGIIAGGFFVIDLVKGLFKS